MFKPILILLLLCSSALAQLKVEVEPFPPGVMTAKSVQVEPLSDRVAVFLTDRDAGPVTGSFLKITSTSKWATPFLDTASFSESTTVPGRWMMFAKPGTYRVTIIEFDPERGPKFTGVEVIVNGAGGPVDPEDPPVDPPPTGDFASLTKFADDAADKIAEPEIRKALAAAYKSAVEMINANSLPYDEAVQTVAGMRYSALSAFPMKTNGWNQVLLKPIGIELGKIVKAGDVKAYTQAISAIQKGLDQ